MSTALKGDVDAILLTGGMAHSQRITDFVAEHVEFIAPIYVYPGEDELFIWNWLRLYLLTKHRVCTGCLKIQ